MAILIIDNTIDVPSDPAGRALKAAWEIRRFVGEPVVVRRGPEMDIPSDPRGYSHVILTGSKTSCLDSAPWVLAEMGFVRAVIDAGVPLLGICYGHQLIARACGGDKAVGASARPEKGDIRVEVVADSPLLEGLARSFETSAAHREEIVALPPGFKLTARNADCAIQAFQIEGKKAFGTQFHPERDTASKGNVAARVIFKNFLELR